MSDARKRTVALGYVARQLSRWSVSLRVASIRADCWDAMALRAGRSVRSTTLAYHRKMPTMVWILYHLWRDEWCFIRWWHQLAFHAILYFDMAV
eukprot:8870314-Ditylum_brightwellii.AAC.1